MRVLVDPVGWYAFLSGMTLLWLVQLVHPSVTCMVTSVRPGQTLQPLVGVYRLDR